MIENRLRELRIEKGLTMQEVLDKANIHTTASHLGAIERYEKGISITLLIKFAEFFDVSTDYLLRLSNKRRKG